ncbi:hypothetical protein AN189_12315 [Loktanella sp. 3ANDIMAR09]|uniref:hypothetical protein n=1 Tax=Loktanella sp. 3ANDIMAR09 TaxID=1225657 RepID=UPI0006FFDD8A|nr:hypothetical protein [Loktanella sp. 3ANDIMAR09]KQI68171.1 hypothetical protein AN189_12315 [Loktanella sp. 3ANDIMAR09]
MSDNVYTLETANSEIDRLAGGGSGNGPDDPGTERRLQALEGQVPNLQADVSDIRARIAHIEGKTSDLPTKDWMHQAMQKYAAALATVMLFGLTVIGWLVTNI